MIGMSRTMAVCETKAKAAGCVEQPTAGESHSGRGFTSSIARED